MLTSKERAELRAQATNIDTTLIVGKEGVTDTVIAEAENQLTARELIKGKVLENSLLTAREACDALCEACNADGVQCIGTKFVLYRRSHTVPADKRIELVGTVARKKTVKAEPAKAASNSATRSRACLS